MDSYRRSPRVGHQRRYRKPDNLVWRWVDMDGGRGYLASKGYPPDGVWPWQASLSIQRPFAQGRIASSQGIVGMMLLGSC